MNNVSFVTLSGVFFFHDITILFLCEQPSATLCLPSLRDCLKICAVIFIFKQYPSTPLPLLFALPLSKAVWNNYTHFIYNIVEHIVRAGSDTNKLKSSENPTQKKFDS